MMESKPKEYTCIREEKLAKHDNDIVELKALAEFKNRRINELAESFKDMDDKLDKISESIQELKLQSAQDDFNIDNRVKSLESKLETLKWITGVALSILSVIVAVISLAMTHIY